MCFKSEIRFALQAQSRLVEMVVFNSGATKDRSFCFSLVQLAFFCLTVAMQHDWSSQENYLLYTFPSFCLILVCLEKVVQDNIQSMILIDPA